MLKPPGFTTVFPYIFASEPDAYLRFLADGLGGSIGTVHRTPDGGVANGQIVFGDTTIMVSDAAGWSGPTQATYISTSRMRTRRSLARSRPGGELFGEVRDQPYRDRQGGVRDPSGNVW